MSDIDTVYLEDGRTRDAITVTAVLASDGSTFLDLGSNKWQGASLHLCPLSSIRVWFEEDKREWKVEIIPLSFT
jgi:hypothetical protein